MVCLNACSHAPAQSEAKAEMDMARDQILKLQEKVQDLETRITALNDKVNLENSGNPTLQTHDSDAPHASVAAPAGQKPMTTEAVSVPVAHAKVIPAQKPPVKASFASNEAVDRFREAKILYDSKRFSDAVLEFSDFLKNEPGHPLAASAQYFLGMSYLKQNEYKLAEEELSRELLSYPHSSHTPDALLALNEISGLLKKPTKAIYFREKILSHFPNSPQAKSLASLQMPLEENEPKVITPDSTGAPANSKKMIHEPESPEAPSIPTAPAPGEDS